MIRPIILLLACRACAGFTSVSRVTMNRPIRHSTPAYNFVNNQQSSASTTYLKASADQEESSVSFDKELNQRLESNNLQQVISYLQSHA